MYVYAFAELLYLAKQLEQIWVNKGKGPLLYPKAQAC